MYDNVVLESKSGTRYGAFETVMEDRKATIFDETVRISVGDTLIWLHPSLGERRYLIESVDVGRGPGAPGRPGTIRQHLTFRPADSMPITAPPPVTKNTTVNIHNSSGGFQIGDNNTLAIHNALNDLVQRINDADASPKEKVEAKESLMGLLRLPLVATVLGSAVKALIEMLSQ
ncbi:hypothetical protein [Rugamonas aquatica]|uniref:Uncharacterized protein n=1 Tax=Rugamonas aquatica TaxID=2743357 RepID=A0A6A7N3J0_9BURK|nr:hypothetical protein [Rugamonas aquatica]MQA39629.1 hypothetical protein [Rugamonas aquatica]